MTLRNILLLAGVAAIVLGLGLGVYVWTHPGARPVGPGAGETAVLVAARPIESGDLLREGDAIWRTIGAGGAPAGALVRGQVSELALVGAVARRAYAPGEPILSGGYIEANDRRFLAAVLAPGDRAVTISVNPAQSASGLILPDDHVDVIFVQDVGGGSAAGAEKRSVAETLIRDARVVAVGASFERAAPAAQTVQRQLVPAASAMPATLTLELSQRDAERLYVALDMGRVELALRSLARAVPLSVEAAAPAEAPVWAADIAPSRILVATAPQAATAATPHRPRRIESGAVAAAEPSIRVIRGSGGLGGPSP